MVDILVFVPISNCPSSVILMTSDISVVQAMYLKNQGYINYMKLNVHTVHGYLKLNSK